MSARTKLALAVAIALTVVLLFLTWRPALG